MRKAIIVVLDSVRQDHVGCYGYGRNTTPNIDKVAEQGSVLDGYIPEPMMPGTTAAAYSFLSGQKKQTIRDTECPQNIPLLQLFANPALFASNHGMFCSLGRWHLGWDYRNLIESRPLASVSGDSTVTWFLWAYGQVKPLLSLLWFVDTHGTYRHDESWTEFMNDGMPPVEGEMRFYDPNLLKENNGVPDCRKHTAYYDAAIHRADNIIAPILDLADDNTLVVVCSDHGDFIGEFGHWFTHNYAVGGDEDYSDVKNVLRPVLMVSSQPTEAIEKVNLMDITATVANWLGLSRQDWWVGRSLVDFYSGPKPELFIEPIDNVALVNERLRALGYLE